MAEKAAAVGHKKAHTSFNSLLVLSILAGAYIAIGGIFSTAATTGANGTLPYGITKLIFGLCFTVGLILVLVGGGELFTGNILIVMAWADGRVTLGELLRNWGIVYLGNFIGSLLMAGLIFWGRQFEFGHGQVGLNMLNIGEAKTALGFGQAVALGILCNFLVCLGVWLAYSARTTTDRIMAIIPPITGFVAAGFEHSVANMYFIPSALLLKLYGSKAFFESIQKTPADFPHLTWSNFLFANLLPVTIGNILGGAVLVGLAYWFIYLKKSQ